MKNRLKEYTPNNNLIKYIDSFWFFRNNTGKEINFPVVPDGCCDIIFYLNNSNKLNNLENPFVSGVMQSARLVPIPKNMEFFGIRFKPAVIWYLLKTDMKNFKDKMCNLSDINKELVKILQIDINAKNKDIITIISTKLEKILLNVDTQDGFLEIVEELCENPEIEIMKFARKNSISVRNLERYFNSRIGVSPKKFTRIMRFQKAHRMISKEGRDDLVEVALSSGYFDQAHFNRDYNKLVGCNPNNVTMSILYNT